MEEDPTKALELLKLLQAARHIDPENMLPSISSKDLRRAISDDKNKGKLIITLFIESSNPAANIFHMKLSPIPKKTRMALAYYVDINENEGVIGDYQLKKAITTILFKNGKELQRFEGMLEQDHMTYIDEHTPADPFSGGSHKITDMDKADVEEYWKNIKRSKEPSSPQDQPKKKVKKVSKYDEFLATHNIGQQVSQNPPPPPPQNVEPTIPFLNPYEEEYANLKEQLQNVSYEDEEINKAILAGCTEMNEASEYIENMRNNTPNNKTLSLPGLNLDNFTPEQREAYEESLNYGLDLVMVAYIILYTGASNIDDIVCLYQERQEGIPLKPKDPVEAEVQRIMNNSPNNFSMTAPPAANNNDFYASIRAAQADVIKEAQEAKRKREAELKHKRDTIEAIKKQREMAKRERESQFAKTTPVNTQKPNSPKKEQNSTTVTIRFRLPNGKTADYVFNTTDTFEAIERKLKDENHINEDDVIEFAIVPTPRIFRKDFGLQLQEKNIKGRIMMSIIVLRQDTPTEQQEPQEQ